MCAADRSSPNVIPGAASARTASALAASCVAEDPGLVFDDPHVHRVDLAREQRGEGPGQPLSDRGGIVHLLGRGQRGQMQLD